MPWPAFFFCVLPALPCAGKQLCLCLCNGLRAKIAADGLVIHARGALAALRRGPCLVIAAVGEKALLGQHGRAGGLFQNAKTVFFAHAGVAAVHYFFAFALVIYKAHARLTAQAVAGAAHALCNAVGKTAGLFIVSAPGRRGVTLKPV